MPIFAYKALYFTTNETFTCEKCNLDSLFPYPPTTGTFTYSIVVSGPGECTQVEVYCQRDDGQSCTSIIVEAITSSPDPLAITERATDTYAASTVECANDGTFSYKNAAFTLTQIERVQCVFNGCTP
ncbi:hypothetical protein B9Z55_017227 [Caenorhabditis nigoni]|uniref:DUF281 domain-containing protein n=1 Tax=Caenorhabditis nigoni TaxID=1611254 RepID=A0A2G5T8F8_9PELO|nr:hypothetical protein B9Z55_017227 [Caenorhabditis nigoni]